MQSFTLEVKHGNQSEYVKCVQTETFFTMARQSDAAIAGELLLEGGQVVGGATSIPGSMDVHYVKNNVVVQTYNEANDPERIIACPWLHKTPLTKDSFVDGSSISDYSYFRQQREAYRKSITWALFQAKLDKKRVRGIVKRAVQDYERRIKVQRGVDISIDMETPAEDMEIVTHLRKRAFSQAQSKMPSTA